MFSKVSSLRWVGIVGDILQKKLEFGGHHRPLQSPQPMNIRRPTCRVKPQKCDSLTGRRTMNKVSRESIKLHISLWKPFDKSSQPACILAAQNEQVTCFRVTPFLCLTGARYWCSVASGPFVPASKHNWTAQFDKRLCASEFTQLWSDTKSQTTQAAGS